MTGTDSRWQIPPAVCYCMGKIDKNCKQTVNMVAFPETKSILNAS